MDADERRSEGEGSDAPARQVKAARAFPWFAYLLLAVLSACVVVAGVGLMFWWSEQGEMGVVKKVRLTAKPDLDLKKIEEVLDTPDYYVEIQSEQGSIRTEEHKDTPLGGGLEFTPPVPVRIADIREVRVYDAEAMGKDRLVDRVDRPVKMTAGEKFRFELAGPEPVKTKARQVGLGLAIAGGVVLLLTILKFVRAQVV